MKNSNASQPDPGIKSPQGDILIVDDSLPNLRTLASLLAEQGYKVRGARDGPTALMIAQGRAPDLILLDVRMPGMDGYQVCQRLKSETKTRDIPVIFISALDEVVDKVKGFAVGGVDFITKPFQIEDVSARVETHLALRALQKQLQVQNAQLQREIAERRRAESALQKAHDELERRVEERTAALSQANANLKMEIAERARTEAELRKYREHLEELVQERTAELEAAQEELIRQERLSALGQLTATVAHEIRNPLGTVRTAVFAVGDAIERDEMHRVERALQLAERNIVRCDNIIRELLDYTREYTLQLEPTPIDAWLAALLDEQALPPGIVCTRELNCGLEIPIDGEYLRRAVVNVVENAVHALQDEKAPGNELHVSTHVVEAQDGPRLEIRVRDTGPGIPGDVRPRIFEPLFSTKSFGVGLGLSIVKNIMEQHGGGIRVQSEAGNDGKGLNPPQGTTIVLWLPT